MLFYMRALFTKDVPMPKQNTRLFGILLLFLFLPWLFFGLGVDILRVPLAPGDGAIQGYPSLMNSKDSSLWNPYVQSGTYQAKNIQTQFLYLPTKLILNLFPNSFGYNLLLLLHYSMAGFFTFLFLKELQLNNFSAILGGILFMFSGFMTGHKGHHAMVMTAAYLPVVIYSFERFYQTRKIWTLLLTGLALGFSFFADYTAVTMYICMMTLLFVTYSAFFRNKGVSLSSRFLFFVQSLIGVFIVALLIGMIQLIPVAESLPYLTREKISYDFFTSYSFGFRDLPLIIFPYIFGTHSPGFYSAYYFSHWNLTELIGYFGILPLFLVPLGLKSKTRHQQYIFWLIGAGLFFLLVLGSSTPFYKIMFKFPVYNLFRVPARNWLEVDFCIAVLSGLAIDRLFVAEFSKVWVKKFLISTSIIFTLIATIMVIILKFVWLFIDNPQLLNNWNNNIKLTSTAVIIPIVITAITYFVMIQIPFTGKPKTLKLGLLLLIILDLFSFGHFHDTGYPTADASNPEKNEVVQFMKSTDPSFENFRIYPINFDTSTDSVYPERNQLFGLSVINDYGPLWLKDYVKVTEFSSDGGSWKQNQLISDNKILSVLSTKYLIGSDPKTIEFINQFRQPLGKYTGEGIFDIEYWTGVDAIEEGFGSYIISSTNPDTVSMIYRDILLTPNVTYDISVDIKQLAYSLEKYSIFIDFYDQANWKDLEGCDYTAELDGKLETQTFSFSFKTGDTQSSHYVMRIFSFSAIPTSVSNISAVTVVLDPQTNTSKNIYYKKVFETQSGETIYQNLKALPRARFISTGVPVSGIEEVVDVMTNTDFDISTR